MVFLINGNSAPKLWIDTLHLAQVKKKHGQSLYFHSI